MRCCKLYELKKKEKKERRKERKKKGTQRQKHKAELFILCLMTLYNPHFFVCTCFTCIVCIFLRYCFPVGFLLSMCAF